MPVLRKVDDARALVGDDFPGILFDEPAAIFMRVVLPAPLGPASAARGPSCRLSVALRIEIAGAER